MEEEQIEPRFKAKDVESVDPLYNEEKLSFENIKKNPILKPIAEINKIYVTFELVVIKALWDYEAEQKKINEMIEDNPKYSETQIMAKVQNLQNSTKSIIHSQDIQKENMKTAIKEMINIVSKEYGVLEEEDIVEAKPKENESETAEENKQEEETKEETSDEEEKEEDTEDKTFYSDLVEKEMPKPQKNKDKEE